MPLLGNLTPKKKRGREPEKRRESSTVIDCQQYEWSFLEFASNKFPPKEAPLKTKREEAEGASLQLPKEQKIKSVPKVYEIPSCCRRLPELLFASASTSRHLSQTSFHKRRDRVRGLTHKTVTCTDPQWSLTHVKHAYGSLVKSGNQVTAPSPNKNSSFVTPNSLQNLEQWSLRIVWIFFLVCTELKWLLCSKRPQSKSKRDVNLCNMVKLIFWWWRPFTFWACKL